MKLDEYQIQKHNRIADNLYSYSLQLYRLKNESSVYSDIYYTNQISNLLDNLKNTIKDVKDLEAHSARKTDKEVANHA